MSATPALLFLVTTIVTTAIIILVVLFILRFVEENVKTGASNFITKKKNLYNANPDYFNNTCFIPD